MKVERKADFAVSDGSCKSATGKTLVEWFNALDGHGGVALGRRSLGQWLLETHNVEAWWATTIVNEYEIARGDLAKDGKPRGYTHLRDEEHQGQRGGLLRPLRLRRGARCLVRREARGRHARRRTLAQCRRQSRHHSEGEPGKNIRLIAEDAGLTLPTPVEIKFAPSGTKCTVMVTIDRLQTRAEADGYRRAWGEALERLKASVETQ